MALENGMDVKNLSATIGHVSAATTVNIKNPYVQLKEQNSLIVYAKWRQFGEISLLSHFSFLGIQ